MDKDQIKGKVDDIAGRVKRQTGEWTGNKDAQVEGAKDQVKGKAEKAVGAIKDAARDLKEKMRNKQTKDKDAA